MFTTLRQAVSPVLLLSLALAGCSRLPSSLRRDIDAENEKLGQAKSQIERSERNVKEEFAAGAATSPDWATRFRDAKSKLESARARSEDLKKLDRSSDRESVLRAERLLSDQHLLRAAATDESDKIEAEAARWLDFERNPQHAQAKIQSEYDTIRAVDLAPVEKAVLKAEQDWPAKKADLDSRLNTLKQAKAKAALPPPQAPIATLIADEEALNTASATLTQGAEDLTAKSAQLYDAWDKILEDLDITNGVYREKVKTVRTHFVDVADKKSEASSDVKWSDVSSSSYHAVENDLGMAIAHKDAGLYDSEATSTAQPPGFAYMASPSVGSNQYGYWTHDQHGSFWTFLPQYLIMRELLWGRSYQPIYVNEYNGYSNAIRSGRTYYGRETPAAPPKYGSHGTFTEQHYASSRYVQSGGFKNSDYASHGTAAAPAPSSSSRFGRAPDSSEGRRFGHGSESPSEGKRFGSGSGSRPSPPGRRFGSSGSRSFGGRRR